MTQRTVESNLFCLIMAGGKGTRFWPESTSKRPKQYLNLLGTKSLLEDTLNRFNGLVEQERRFIVTIKEQESLASIKSKDLIGKNGLIFEPSGRNTAPCILLSLAMLLEHGAQEDDVVAIMPSDHVILNHNGFKEVVKEAHVLATQEEKIVTIGVTPYFPHTGYGYIQRGKQLRNNSYEVMKFREKPDLQTAKEYITSGQYYWNAGMFVGSIKVFLEEFQAHASNIYAYYHKLRDNIENFEKISSIYKDIPVDSIDFAIMEKSARVLVTAACFDWNDLGSWDALESVISSEDNNTVVTDKKHYFDNAQGNIVFAPNQFVSLVDVKDLIIVSNDNALLILPKQESQRVKKVVDYLKEQDFAQDLI